MWSLVTWSNPKWFIWNDCVLKWSEVKGVTAKLLGARVPCILRWPYTEGTWLYSDCFIWCVSFTVVVLTCFVMCGCVDVVIFWQLCECFGNMCTSIYCVLYCVCCVFVLFRLCIFIFIYFCLYWCTDYCHQVTAVCTGVRTTATEWQLSVLV
jgi:hypothetical protein